MSIKLFTEIIQPFGVLGNDAKIDMKIDSKSYESVTQYVYSKLVEGKPIPNRIPNDSCGTVIREIYKNDVELFTDRLMDAMAVKYLNDQQAKDKIKKGYILNYNFTQSLLKLCDNKKSSFKPPFFDKLSDNTILLSSQDNELMCKNMSTRLNKIVHRIQRDEKETFYDSVHAELDKRAVNNMGFDMTQELMKNASAYDNRNIKTIYDIYKKKLKIREYDAPLTKDQRELIETLYTIDDIVIELKKKYSKEIYKSDIDKFKDHLFTTALTYILQTDYTHLQPADYNKAILENVNKQKHRAATLRDRLYDMFINNQIPPDIKNKLTMRLPVEVYDDALSLSPIPEEPEAGFVFTADAVVPMNDILMPHLPYKTTIRNKTYNSPVAYAYSCMFQQLTKMSEEDANAKVNATTLDVLAQEYHKARHERFTENVIEFNRVATFHKFRHDPSLQTLLLQTGGDSITYDNPLDFILGGPTNISGKLLESIRSSVIAARTNNPTYQLPKKFRNLSSNAVVRTWFRSKLFEYSNTLRLFKTPTKELLLSIHDLEEMKNVDDRSVTFVNEEMAKFEISQRDQPIVRQCLLRELHYFNSKNGISTMVESYNITKPTDTEDSRARLMVSSIYAAIPEGQLNCDKKHFTDTLLGIPISGSISGSLTEQWWRVHKFANMFTRKPILPMFADAPVVSYNGWSDDMGDTVLHYQAPDVYWTTRMIAFDLESLTFPQTIKVDPSKIEFISRYVSHQDYMFVIFDYLPPSQSSQYPKDRLQNGFEQFIKQINLPFEMFISIDVDKYAKPLPYMWHHLYTTLYNVNIKITNATYIGAKAGRNASESAADYLFAKNSKIHFKTPEEFFNNANKDVNVGSNIPPYPTTHQPTHQTTSPTTSQTMEERPLYDPPNTKVDPAYKEIIILVGYNGSGKTTFAYRYLNSYMRISSVDQKESIKTFFNDDPNRSIVIDDTDNVSSEHRKQYEDVAKEIGVQCRYFCFILPYYHRLHNIKFRRLTNSDYAGDDDTPETDETFMNDLTSDETRDIVRVNFIPKFGKQEDKQMYNMFLLDRK